MEDEEIAKAFRAEELKRRSTRRQLLINAAALEDEPLTYDERRITRETLEKIRLAEERYQTAIGRFGFWKTLWFRFKEFLHAHR